jgi:hypothetical protein
MQRIDMKKPSTIILVILILSMLVFSGLRYLLGGRVGSATPDSSGQAGSARAGQSIFTEDSLGFFFTVPPGFRAQKLLDDSGETILVQSADDTHGFQVYITSFSDPASSITKGRIENEAGMTVANEAPLTVAGVAQGLQFNSTADTPPTRQAWFVYNGDLYQVLTWASDESLLQTVLASWQFRS